MANCCKLAIRHERVQIRASALSGKLVSSAAGSILCPPEHSGDPATQLLKTPLLGYQNQTVPHSLDSERRSSTQSEILAELFRYRQLPLSAILVVVRNSTAAVFNAVAIQSPR